MLGSLSEVDDALQETWIRASNASNAGDDVENLGGWLTTIVSRVCLNMLRSRATRREASLEVNIHVPDPIIDQPGAIDPEHDALLANSVGLALMVVLDTLGPAERMAFVLHDMFAVPFDEIADLIDKTPAATRQLASRARRRVRDGAPAPDPDLARQRIAVDAYLAATREGDFQALVSVLDPDVVLRSDGGLTRQRYTVELRGAETVASQAQLAKRLAPFAQPALINGAAGVVTVMNGRIQSVMSFTVIDDKIVAIEVLTDPNRLATLSPPRSQMRGASG
jgi:RNA polymerase sigma factor (sigma-70 family)